MVRTSGIREKFRSKALQKLKNERGTKRSRNEVKEESESDDDTGQDRRSTQSKTNNSLLSILPKPKNSNAFGPTVNLEKLLTSNRNLTPREEQRDKEEIEELVADEDEAVEFDVSKVISDNNIKTNFTIEEHCGVFVPKGKEKSKNQITYIAALGKASELERKEKDAQSKFNKAAARAKYGW